MFFYFLKIIFNISILKRSKKYKPHLILIKNKIKQIQNFLKYRLKRNIKRGIGMFRLGGPSQLRLDLEG